MKALWIEDEASFHGEFVNFDPVWSYPKPVQRPHPPILLGGETDKTLARIVEFCDGWFPRGSADFDPAVAVGRLKAACAEAGRDFAGMSITVFRAPADADALKRYADAGITRVLLDAPDSDRDEVLRLLDQYAAFVAKTV
jgi:alkanesulfonate monooxygenase SsuD/methylene tetrahydromethanopterin reductase-like flavin-dependent oxidoreductase (luciferase family)